VKNKEVRIALAVVATLLLLFAGVLIWKLGWSGRAGDPVAAEPPARDQGALPAGSPVEPPAAAPTVLTATQSLADRGPAEPRTADGQSWQGTYSGREEPRAHDRLAAEPADDQQAHWGPDDDGQADPFAAQQTPPPQSNRWATEDDPAVPDGSPPAPGAGRNELRAAPPAGVTNPLRRGEPQQSPPAQPLPPGEQFSAAAPPDSNLDPALGDEPPVDRPPAPWPEPRSDESHAAEALADSEPAEAYEPDGSQADDLSLGHDRSLPADLAGDAREPASAEVSAAAQAAQTANSRPPRVLPEPVSPSGAASATRGLERQVTPASAERDLGKAQLSEALPEGGQYRVAPRDTFWLIARKVYGEPGYYRALYEHNRRTHPRADKLPAGTLLETPDAETLERLYPEFCPRPPATSDDDSL
jgi:hypothetical protein